MTPIDPDFATTAGRSANDYIAVLQRLWPIALTGGVMGVAIHAREISRSGSKLAALAIAATEWTVGASASMVLATIVPSFTGLLPDGINLTTAEAELGLYGFIGGTFGRRIFRWLWDKIFTGKTAGQ